ncbi:MAG: 2-oxoacid:acceptor oxidoreductase family protein [Spirochaetaceae bacterium]|nr:2-oxoacid:acceptor oxidoreductase family protein [Spirochaetaceae bacterium]
MNEKLIIAGFGGQGVMTLGQLLCYTANNKDLHTLWFPSYGPETRGGTANCSVLISDTPINSPVISVPDTAIVLNLPSLTKFMPKVKAGGNFFYNSSLIEPENLRTDLNVYEVPVNDIAAKLGNLKVANIVMLGAYLAVTKFFNKEEIEAVLKKTFGEKKQHLIPINMEALDAGRDYLVKQGKIK